MESSGQPHWVGLSPGHTVSGYTDIRSHRERIYNNRDLYKRPTVVCTSYMQRSTLEMPSSRQLWRHDSGSFLGCGQESFGNVERVSRILFNHGRWLLERPCFHNTIPLGPHKMKMLVFCRQQHNVYAPLYNTPLD